MTKESLSKLATIGGKNFSGSTDGEKQSISAYYRIRDVIENTKHCFCWR
jgi:hypothetical protein